MSSQFILPLKKALDLELVGGKAVNLAKMMQAELPVPDGFVITTEAFKNAQSGKVSEELAIQISEAFASLGSDLVAARSSATAEDMAGASMAGQYETYLNLASVEEVIDGIEKCWQSIRSERTTAYLKEHNIDPDEVAMAVVVQKLVSADVAGVLFTVDPKTGSRDSMLIEANWGLGESLVSGEVQPDVITVHSSDEIVESYQVAEKKQAMFPGQKGLQEVKKQKQKKACLPYEQIIRLQQLGKLAVSHFGSEQDIEWAVGDNEVYMLQARPITTLDEVDAYNKTLADIKSELNDLSEKEQGPWVRHNIGETLPHPTPFTWDLVANFMSADGGFGRMHKDLGFVPGPAVQDGKSFLKRVGGEVYMDCSLMTEMFSENYPFKYDVEKLRSNPDAAQNPPSLPSGSIKEINAAAEQSVSVARKLGELAVNLDKEFDSSFVPNLLKWCRKQAEYDLQNLSDKELLELWDAQVDKVMNDFGNTAFMPSMVEALAVENLRTFLEEYSWNEDPAELLSTLSVSQKADSTFSANLDLESVGKSKMTILEWLDEHGHRAPGEFELATPRWFERPADLENMAKQVSADGDLEKIHHDRIEKAKKSAQDFGKTLTPKLAADFNERLDLLQRYSHFREDGKYYFIKAYAVLRKTALEFGRRLEIAEEVFFLRPAEVRESLECGFVPKDKIAQRKLQYEVEKRIQLPHVIDAEDIPTLGTVSVLEDGDSLKAFSVSNGTCSGPVAIVHSPEEVKELPEGAILVCPSTDPSWTPLFVKASGLILERGGSLSHGAVVAREMGLPALVLDGATKILNDGETVSLDANSGWIYREGAQKEEDTEIPMSLIPPPVSTKERKANQLGLLAAIAWGIFLGAVYLLPPDILLNPIMSMIDVTVWPFIRSLGMVGAVAVVAVGFALIPIIMQKYMTDNYRLFEGKRRSNLLLKEAKTLDADSPRRKKLEALAAPITKRVLKASMVPLAFILGPMMMIFMWFPERVDPLSWSSDPGRMVSIVAEVDGETAEDIVLEVPDSLSVNGSQSEVKKLPPIRQELEELRSEWKNASDMSDLPWEVQSAGDHTRQLMIASLNSYLREGVPPQKVTWLVNVPENALGTHKVNLKVGKESGADFKLVFGKADPPMRGMVKPTSSVVKSVTVNYPRALQKAVFWTPLNKVGGPNWDFGWLGVYLLVYLPLMFIAKFALRVP